MNFSSLTKAIYRSQKVPIHSFLQILCWQGASATNDTVSNSSTKCSGAFRSPRELRRYPRALRGRRTVTVTVLRLGNTPLVRRAKR